MYNVADYIERCIESCESQDIEKTEYELIVINDGSKDNSLEIAITLQSKYSNIKIFSQENMGLSSARNLGITKAEGDYIWFVDSDDWIKSNCLGYIRKRICNCDVDVAELMAVDVLEKEERLYYNLVDNIQMTGPECLKSMVMPCAPFYIWKRSFIIKEQLSFYKGIFHEDMEFTPRALYLASKVMTIAEVFYYVYQNPNSITRSINPKKSFDYICHVCDSLYTFSSDVEENSKTKFYYFIAMCLNNALDNIKDANKNYRDKFIQEINKRHYLLKVLSLSGIKKYKIEYYLFKFSPFNIVKTYNILTKLMNTI